MHVSRTLVSKQDPFRSAAPIAFSMLCVLHTESDRCSVWLVRLIPRWPFDARAHVHIHVNAYVLPAPPPGQIKQYRSRLPQARPKRNGCKLCYLRRR